MTMPNTLAMAVAALPCVVWLKGMMDCPIICMTRVIDTVCVPEAKPLAEALAEPGLLPVAGAAEGATAEAAKEEDNAAVGSTLQGQAQEKSGCGSGAEKGESAKAAGSAV